MMLKFSLPIEAGNEAIRTGKIAKVLEALMTDLKPEAAYFFAERGERTSLFVFDMQDSSQVAQVAERCFFGLNATVELTPVMTADDLRKGLADVETIIKNFG
jgi:hypothetical protein